MIESGKGGFEGLLASRQRDGRQDKSPF